MEKTNLFCILDLKTVLPFGLFVLAWPLSSLYFFQQVSLSQRYHLKGRNIYSKYYDDYYPLTHPPPRMKNQQKVYDSGREKENFTKAISMIHKIPMPTPLTKRSKDYYYSTVRFQFFVSMYSPPPGKHWRNLIRFHKLKDKVQVMLSNPGSIVFTESQR